MIFARAFYSIVHQFANVFPFYLHILFTCLGCEKKLSMTTFWNLELQNENFKFLFFQNYLFLVLAVPSTVTDPDDEDEDDFDDSEESAEADDDSRIYKNPRNSPSSDCPRDEEQATLLGQKCLRKCSSHEDCKSKKKKCLCDGACGMSCIKPGTYF